MDIFRVCFISVLFCVFVAGLPPYAAPNKNIQEEDIKALLVKEKESEGLPPKELSKEITFVHKYNDTEGKENRHVFSKLNSLGGLENKIQNSGGVQRTVVKNKIQYNFYFWLVPKNFTGLAQTHENR